MDTMKNKEEEKIESFKMMDPNKANKNKNHPKLQKMSEFGFLLLKFFKSIKFIQYIDVLIILHTEIQLYALIY